MHARSMTVLLLSIVVLAAAACAPQPAEEPQDGSNATLYEGATLIVGDSSATVENSAFLVEDGQFTAVGASGELDVPEGAARVDLTGQTVMPAIVDAHKHVAATRDETVALLQQFAYHGVGAVMSLGLDSDEAFQLAQEERMPGAARLLSAGRGLTMPEPGRSEVPYWVSTEEEARAAVQELATQPVDLIKIWVDDRNGMYEKLSPALYGAIIDEAHNNGLRVTAHIFALEDAKGLLEAGVDAFAHGVRDQDVDDEFVAMVQERPDVVLVPNMPNRGVAVDLGWLAGAIPAEQLEQMQANSTDQPEAQESFGIQARNLARLNEAGMRIALGTDGSTPWAPHLEMEDMVAAGMTPAEVIAAATGNAAEFLGLADAGTVEAGKSADFIVLDANPLDDITNTRSIASVYIMGDRVDRESMMQE